jgi:hypothetical protein
VGWSERVERAPYSTILIHRPHSTILIQRLPAAGIPLGTMSPCDRATTAAARERALWMHWAEEEAVGEYSR